MSTRNSLPTENTSNIEVLSAAQRVCSVFLDACKKEGVSPAVALKAIAGFIGSTLPEVQSTSSGSVTLPLTKGQRKEAIRQARQQKAKRLNVSTREVNLTSEEIQQAIRSYTPGSPKLSRTGARNMSTSPQENSESDASSAASDDHQRSRGSKTRKTLGTRLRQAKKNAEKAIPNGEHGAGLHLVAYANAYHRLQAQWDSAKGTLSSTHQNPLLGLPNPFELGKTSACLKGLTDQLQEQDGDPGTYRLQDSSGKSYWDGGKPSAVCPAFLSDPLPTEVLDELSGALTLEV